MTSGINSEGTENTTPRSSDATSSSTSTAHRSRKGIKSKSFVPYIPSGEFHIPARDPGNNPLKNWSAMEPPSVDDVTERPKPCIITPLPLDKLKGKSEAETAAIIAEYQVEAQYELEVYAKTLAKYQRYEIQVRLDECRRGLPLNCTDAIIKQAVEEIIATQIALKDPWEFTHESFTVEDPDDAAERKYQETKAQLLNEQKQSGSQQEIWNTDLRNPGLNRNLKNLEDANSNPGSLEKAAALDRDEGNYNYIHISV